MKAMPTKQKLNEIRVQMQEALDKVAKEFKIESIKLGNMSYDESGFRVPLEAIFEGGESKELKSLRLNAFLFGFKPEIAGAEITLTNVKYKVVGIKRTKLTIIRLSDNKTFVAPIDNVLRSLKLQKSPLVLEDKTSMSI